MSPRRNTTAARTDALRAQRVLADSPLPTVLLSRDLRVEFWNEAAERVFGWQADELIGTTQIPIVPPGREEEAREFQRRLTAGETLHGIETVRMAKDGTLIDVAIYGSRFADDVGGGVAVRFVDLRERRRLEAVARAETERRLALAAERQREAEKRRILAEFSAAAGTAVDTRQVLAELATRAADALAAACLIHTPVPGIDELELVALGASDPRSGELLRSIFAARRLRPSDGGVTGTALSSGRTASSYISEADRASYLESLAPDRRTAVAELDIRAAAAVPLPISVGETGALTFLRFGPEAAPFDGSDVAFAEELAVGGSLALTRLAHEARVRQEEERKRVLAEFLAAAMQADDDAAALELLASQIARSLRAACGIYRPTPDGRELALAGAASAISVTAEQMRAVYGARRAQVGEGILGRAFATGRSAIVEWITDEAFHALIEALEPEHRVVIAALQPRSTIAVPIRALGEVVGALNVVRVGDGATPFTREDLEYAEDYATRASVALDRLALLRDRNRTSRVLETVFHASPLPIVAVDEGLRVTVWNAAAERVYGWTRDEVFGQPPPYAPPEDAAAVSDAFDRLASGESSVIAMDAIRQTKDGRRIYVRAHGAALFDEAGRFGGAVGISEDITAHRHADAMREAFIDVTAHELKTPLTTMYAAIETLIRRRAHLSDSVQSELLADTAAETERLVHLVDNLVVLSRVERGHRFTLEEPVLLRETAKAAISAAARREGGAVAQLRVEGDEVPVIGDQVYVEQILLNLLLNAARYGQPPVEVAIERVHDGMRVDVLDRGRGFEADSERLFDLYFRDPSRSRTPGSGIGLFVVRSLVEMMGGHVWAANRADGGAAFGFFLPAYAAELEQVG